MNQSTLIKNLNLALPTVHKFHSPDTYLYKLLKRVARMEIESLFKTKSDNAKEFYPFGKLIFPYFKMGKIDSLNLFDLDELILFSFYWCNRKKYKKVLDIGANIGLHSIILSKCGYQVQAFEPDPVHFKMLNRNLMLNKCGKVRVFESAVSDKSGEMEFIRVLGNTTGSHLAGSKLNPYGKLKRFPVKVKSIKDLFKWADLIKMDVEGHEKIILLATDNSHWTHTDAMVEVGSEANAEAIFNHFKSLGIKLYSQKTNWQMVKNLKGMPKSHLEGSLFVTNKKMVPWPDNYSKFN